MTKGPSLTQVVRKQTKDELTRIILTTLPAITEDIKRYLDGIMNDAAASDQDVQRILGVFDNEENPIIFDFVESETKPLVHTGFNIIINIADVEDLVVSVVPAGFISDYFNGLDIDVRGEINSIAIRHIAEVRNGIRI